MELKGAMNNNCKTHIEYDEIVNRAPVRYRIVDNESGDILSEIDFQDGQVRVEGVNGITNEDLIDIVIHRLQRYKHNKENDLAIINLKQSLMWLNERSKRKDRIVNGDNNEKEK